MEARINFRETASPVNVTPGVTYVGRQQQNIIFYFARRLRLPAGDEHSEWGEKKRRRWPLFLHRCAAHLGVWPTLPAPVRIGSRQDICHTLLFRSPPVLLLQATRTPQSDSLSNREARQRRSLLPLEDTEPQAALTSANLNQPQCPPALTPPASLPLVLGSGCEASPACPRTPAAAAASTSWCCREHKKNPRCQRPPALDSQFGGLSAPFM